MTPKEFIKKLYPYAIEVENDTGIPAVAIMAQAALESGWGKSSIGNNVFGIKYRRGDPGFQKVLTTEYDKDRNAYNGQEVKSVIFDGKKGVYVFKVYQYFADYPSPKDAFLAHARLLLSNRYKHCLRWKNSPKRFLIAVWRAGYATDVDYGKKICKMVDSVLKRLPQRQPTFRPSKMQPLKAKVK
jgi:flagellum-specific peptidoglycan hydrolase FlgJ